MPFDVFISYARKDKKLRDRLAEHLSGLRNDGTINDWFDGDIVEGTEWEPELFDHLNTAQIILLLISSNFLASDFSYRVEMKQALARHDAGEARVIPIILRPSDWKNAPFAKIQALPTDARAVTTWSNRDEAFVSIVKGIKRAIRDLENSAAQATTTAPFSQKSSNNQHNPVTVPSTSTVHNHIGSISGSQHTIVQTGTQHITTHHYYGSSDRTGRVSPSQKKRAKSNEDS